MLETWFKQWRYHARTYQIAAGLLALLWLIIVWECWPRTITIVPQTQNTAAVLPKITFKDLDGPIFGQYVDPGLDANQLEESRLDITIVGIMFGVKPADREVVLRLSNQEEKSFSEGEGISPGVRLLKIMQDSIVVKHAGKLERLSFPENQLRFEPLDSPIKMSP